MPFKKRTNRRKGYVTKTQVKKMIEKNTETKTVEHAWASQTIPDGALGGYQFNLMTMAQNVTNGARVGEEILMTGMYARLQITGADTTNIVRVILYIPHDNDDILSSITTYQIPDKTLYTVLFDRYVTLTANGEYIKQMNIKQNYHKGRRKGIKIKYTGTTTTPAHNNIKMTVVSDSGAVSHPEMSGNMIIYYKDG